jgi:hypothetical protein
MGSPLPVPLSDHERERAAALLQRSCGEGRLTLEEFSVRVGAVWSAETGDELARATAGLTAEPVVGSTETVDSILTLFSESKRQGRWRLRGGRLWSRTYFGVTELDLRAVLTDDSVIEIGGVCAFGQLKVIVPEGVEVHVTGSTVFATRTIDLAPVPRVPGTPEIRINVDGWFSTVEVYSRRYALPR